MSDLKTLLRLKPFIKEYKLFIFIGILGVIMRTVLNAPIPYMMGDITDKVLIQHGSKNYFYKIALVILVLYIFSYLLSIGTKYLFIKINIGISNNIKLKIIEKSIDFPMSYYNKNDKGYILSRISESDTAGSLFSSSNVSTLAGIIELMFSLGMVLYINAQLSIIILITIPIHFFLVKKSAKTISLNTTKVLEDGALLASEVYETLNGIEEIKILNAKHSQLNKITERISILIKSVIKQASNVMLYMENLTLIFTFSGFILFVLAGIMILNGNFTLGNYTAFAGYTSKILGNTQLLASFSLTLTPVLVSLKRVVELLDVEGEDDNKTQIIHEDCDITKIIIDNLSFKYDEESKYIFNNFNLDINKGDNLLISGSNGSGKSTLIKLLLGLYPPTHGEIYFNDKKFSDLNKSNLRKRIGIVSQEPYLFKGNVLENIFYYKEEKSKKELIEKIEKFKLNDYINNFENGIDTQIAYNGANLSGGQKQVISFLRAISSKKDIIILDEATANMDVEIKKRFVDIIKNNDLCNIMIVISHEKEFSFVNKNLNLDKI